MTKTADESVSPTNHGLPPSRRLVHILKHAMVVVAARSSPIATHTHFLSTMLILPFCHSETRNKKRKSRAVAHVPSPSSMLRITGVLDGGTSSVLDSGSISKTSRYIQSCHVISARGTGLRSGCHPNSHHSGRRFFLLTSALFRLGALGLICLGVPNPNRDCFTIRAAASWGATTDLTLDVTCRSKKRCFLCVFFLNYSERERERERWPSPSRVKPASAVSRVPIYFDTGPVHGRSGPILQCWLITYITMHRVKDKRQRGQAKDGC